MEEKLCPMLVEIERKSRSGRPAVPHSPQHRQAAQLIEAIAGINECRAARLRILSEELKGLQGPLSPSTDLLSLSHPISFNLHLLCLQSGLKDLRCLLLSTRRLYC